MPLNERQEKVVVSRNKHVLVPAAAGSGKTHTLTERICSRVSDEENPVDIDRLLIVTFTKAAAAEMRERIGARIREELIKNPDNANLIKQEILLQNAQITTIDAFCSYIVRNHFHTIGIDPVFRVAESGEISLIQDDVLAELFEKHYAENQNLEDQETDFSILVDAYEESVEADKKTGFSNKKSLKELVKETAIYALGLADPENWLKECKEEALAELHGEPMDFPWFSDVIKDADTKLKALLPDLDAAINLYDKENATNGYYKPLCDYKKIAEGVTKANSYEEKWKVFADTELHVFDKSGKRTSANNETKGIAGTAKTIIEDLKASVFALSYAEITETTRYVSRYTHQFVVLVEEFLTAFAEAKREQGIVDFSDLEHFAFEILSEKDEEGNRVPSAVAKEYQEYFAEIMVDEYQDSSFLQEAILKMLIHPEGKNTYFMVGDVKQSIYRFRNARPEIFMEKYDAFGKDEKTERIDLNENFRSRESVTSFVNNVFSGLMVPSIGKISYDEEAKLHFGAKYPSADTEVHTPELLLVPYAKTDKEYASKTELEAQMIVNRIQKLFQAGTMVFDKKKGEERPIEYRDIVILMRSYKGVTDVYRTAFEKAGIPFVYDAKSGFFDTREIKDIVNYLRVIDNPLEDIPLYGCMTSFFGKFTEEEMASFKAKMKEWEQEERKAWKSKQGDNADLKHFKMPLYSLLLKEREENPKIDQFLKTVESYREKATYLSVRELIHEIIERSGYQIYMTAFPGGAQRVANLQVLLDRAEAFEQTSFHGLFHFCRFLSKLKERDADLGEASAALDDMNAVRLMTVHNSKGLEYPICFFSNLHKSITLADESGEVLKDAELHIALDYINPKTRIKRSTIRKKLLQEKNHRDTIAEEIRVLYVALTRAREKVILTGVVDDAGTVSENEVGDKVREISYLKDFLDKEVKDEDLLAAKTDLELILLGLRKNSILPKYLKAENLYDRKRLTEEAFVNDVNQNYQKDTLMKSQVLQSDLDALKEKICFSYEHENLQNLYQKTTVTDLKKKAFEEEAEHYMFPEDHEEKAWEVPSFARKEKPEILGTNRGTAYHRLMELTDFKNLPETDYASFFQSVKERAIGEEKILEEEAELVMEDKAVRFYESDLARRMAVSDLKGKLYKEKPFFMGIPANEIESEFPEDELIIVQGVIDVFFEEEDGVVLMDYKTDQVATGDELIKRYQAQLYYYQRAIENATGIKVKERLIYSFALGQVVPVPEITKK